MLTPHLALSLGLFIAIPLSLDAALLTCHIDLVDGVISKVCRKLKCPVNCSNGACSLHLQRCICHDGYQRMDDKCVPTCDKPVCSENEHCLAPNKCDCNDGYSLVDNQCQPKCETGCVETKYCAAPNSCVCKEGYIATTNGGCEPICSMECGQFGRCISPNICDCDEGYRMQAEGKCAPVCDAELCANADCIAPYKCICHAGYSLNFDNGKCEALPEDEVTKSQSNATVWIDVRSGIIE